VVDSGGVGTVSVSLSVCHVTEVNGEERESVVGYDYE